MDCCCVHMCAAVAAGLATILPQATVGTCGNGKLGNRQCTDPSMCCSFKGLCGNTPSCCDANGLAAGGPAKWYGDSNCGAGVRGSGICPYVVGHKSQDCCSPDGYCGTSPSFCNGPPPRSDTRKFCAQHSPPMGTMHNSEGVMQGHRKRMPQVVHSIKL